MRNDHECRYHKDENEGNQGFRERDGATSEISEVSEVTAVAEVEVKEKTESSEITERVLKTPAETLEETLRKASEMKIPATPAGYRISPQYRELKTHRTQLVFPPSLFRKAKKRAQQLNVSLNEFICLILQAIVGNDVDPKK